MSELSDIREREKLTSVIAIVIVPIIVVVVVILTIASIVVMSVIIGMGCHLCGWLYQAYGCAWPTRTTAIALKPVRGLRKREEEQAGGSRPGRREDPRGRRGEEVERERVGERAASAGRREREQESEKERDKVR